MTVIVDNRWHLLTSVDICWQSLTSVDNHYCWQLLTCLNGSFAFGRISHFCTTFTFKSYHDHDRWRCCCCCYCSFCCVNDAVFSVTSSMWSTPANKNLGWWRWTCTLGHCVDRCRDSAHLKTFVNIIGNTNIAALIGWSPILYNFYHLETCGGRVSRDLTLSSNVAVVSVES